MKRLDCARGISPSDSAGEGGYVMVLVALSMTVILGFTAFTIDYGSWYNRSAQLKRAADAAALAGVVWMPDFEAAESHALAAAQRNGFVDGGNIVVDVHQVSGNDRQLEVSIRDKKAKQFFSRVVLQNQSIGRTSMAEYVLGVPLGSPKNTLGTGNLSFNAAVPTENFWAAASGYCSGHENGDKKLAFYESNETSTNNSASKCNNDTQTDENPSYKAEGYLYAIELPAGASTMTLQAYDAPFYNAPNVQGTPPVDVNADQEFGGVNNTQQVTTTFTGYNRILTPLDLTTLTPATGCTKTFTTNQDQANLQAKWTNLCTWTNPAAGTYYVRVQTPVQLQNSRGSNAFGFRVYTGGTFSLCTTIKGQTGYNVNCPQIHGVTDMSIRASLTGGTATFYFASIDEIHAGKTLKINLFDPGEGATSISILDPNDQPTEFDWSTPTGSPLVLRGPTGGGSGTTLSSASPPYSLNVSGGCDDSPAMAQPFDGLNSHCRYNDRDMTLNIQLDKQYATTYLDSATGKVKTWWKIKYTFNGSASDRTTWSASIVGDPVHLVN